MSARCKAESARSPWRRKACCIAWLRIRVWQTSRARALGPEVATTVWTVVVNQWIIRAMPSRLRGAGSASLACVDMEAVDFDVDEVPLLLEFWVSSCEGVLVVQIMVVAGRYLQAISRDIHLSHDGFFSSHCV